jgi:hypothetical protein
MLEEGGRMSRFVTTLKTDQTDRRTYKLLDDLVLADEDLGAIIVPPASSRTSPASRCCTTPFCSFVRFGGRLRQLRRDRA